MGGSFVCMRCDIELGRTGEVHPMIALSGQIEIDKPRHGDQVYSVSGV